MLTLYLVYSDYGFEGNFQGAHYVVHCGGVSIFEVTHDGTLEEEAIALDSEMRSSGYVKQFEQIALASQIPFNYGRWFVFSVINKEVVSF